MTKRQEQQTRKEKKSSTEALTGGIFRSLSRVERKLPLKMQTQANEPILNTGRTGL